VWRRKREGERDGDEDRNQRKRCRQWREKGRSPREGRAEKEKWNSPKELCAILENCRDLSVK
jgi:hypothetical protein